MRLKQLLLMLFVASLFACSSHQVASIGHGTPRKPSDAEKNVVRDCTESKKSLTGANKVLFDYASKTFGMMKDCNSAITAHYEGQDFTTTTYGFGNGASMITLFSPPETSANEIRNDQGLNDKEARLLIEEAAAKAQLKINWGKPPESMDSDNGTVQKTYWDTESGLNGRGYFIYKKDILIGAGYGMAL